MIMEILRRTRSVRGPTGITCRALGAGGEPLIDNEKLAARMDGEGLAGTGALRGTRCVSPELAESSDCRG